MDNLSSQGRGRPVVLQAAGVTLPVILAVVVVTVVLAGVVVFLAGGPVVGAILTGVGLVMVLFVSPRLRAARRWRAPEFEFDSLPLMLGGEARLTYRLRPKKRGTTVVAAPVRLSFECVEEATYTVGSSTRTDRATVYQHDEQLDGGPGPDGFEVTARLIVPVDAGAPSLDLRRNQITWRLEARVRGKGYPAAARRVEVPVAAHLAPAANPGQDLINDWGN